MRKVLILFALIALAIAGLGVSKADALAGSEWQAGRIIDDSIFFNGHTMGTNEVQLFLNSKVPACDTNGTQPYGGTTRAAYGTSQGNPPPYICLRDYKQDTPTKGAEAGLCSQYNGGNKSAAQIINDIATACGVNPKVLLVLLEKEQSLVTDTWPWNIQYRSATGYGCPDTAPCDAEYYGFFNQVYNAARQFKRYERDASSFRYRSNRDNFIQYNPNAACDGTNVYIQNQATAGLYNYTPYQPNSAALNNLYGAGDGCSAYGNRNFWRLFNDWFGSLNGPAYSWQQTSMQFYSDAARTKPYTAATTLQPGAKAYVRIKAKNTGYLHWEPSFMRIGTSNPRDHSSPYSNDSWLNSARPAQLMESRVEPSQTGTFEFSITAPSTPGTYRQYINLVAEGYTWLNDMNTYFSFNVVSPVAVPSPSVTRLNSGESLATDSPLLAPLNQASLVAQKDGNLVLYQDYQPVWFTGTSDKGKKLVMQTDGNLVFYSENNFPIWFSNTGGNPGAYMSLQLDGNLVVYSASGAPLWSAGKSHNPSYQSYVNIALNAGSLWRGQWIETADRKYKMILQEDGNLVIYSPRRPIWATFTNGLQVSRLFMQADGNLVLYDINNRPVWHTGTYGQGFSALTMQEDGNLVTYNGLGIPTWQSRTSGLQ